MQLVAVEQLAQDQLQRGAAHRPGDAQLAQGIIEPIEMRALVDHLAVDDRHHLVDAVGELVPAILDMDRRLSMRDVAPVDIRVSCHRILRKTRA